MSSKFRNCVASVWLLTHPQALFATSATEVTEFSSQLSVYGGAGLIQLPTARHFNDGSALLQYQDVGPYRFWSVSVQAMPWLEMVLRYSDIRALSYSADPDFSGDQTLKDKGIDVKIRLIQEQNAWPEVSLGLRDIGGTRIFASEYLLFSKRWPADSQVDWHAGIGMGRLGSRNSISNPFCQIDSDYCQRSNIISGQGGDFSAHDYFRGQAAAFAGLSWQIDNWQFQLEYDSQDYQTDYAGPLVQHSRLNYGVSLLATPTLQFNLAYQRGNQVSVGVNYRFNLHEPADVTQISPATLPALLPPPGSDVAMQPLLQRLMAETGFRTERVQLGTDQILLRGHATGYRSHSELVQRMGRILAGALPQHIRRYHLQFTEQSVVVLDTVLDAPRFIAAVRGQQAIGPTISRQDSVESTYHAALQVRSAPWFLLWRPYLSQSFGQPERFYSWQLGVSAGGGLQLADGWQLISTLQTAPFGNFRKMNFYQDGQQSDVPRVRTLIRYYLDRDLWLDTLYSSWFTSLTPDYYLAFYAGYLETMFAGIGGELLYRPVDQGFAIGVDINSVRQRDYRNETGLMDYAVTTGHVSLYWQLPGAPELQLSTKIGRYLAGDHGVTVELARRFDGGIVLGAYASKTDMSKQQYGEGSFTKGLYLSVPFEYFSGKPGRGRGVLPWQPISRDGGQLLNRPLPLYNVTESRSPFTDR